MTWFFKVIFSTTSSEVTIQSRKGLSKPPEKGLLEEPGRYLQFEVIMATPQKMESSEWINYVLSSLLGVLYPLISIGIPADQNSVVGL